MVRQTQRVNHRYSSISSNSDTPKQKQSVIRSVSISSKSQSILSRSHWKKRRASSSSKGVGKRENSYSSSMSLSTESDSLSLSSSESPQESSREIVRRNSELQPLRISMDKESSQSISSSISSQSTTSTIGSSHSASSTTTETSSTSSVSSNGWRGMIESIKEHKVLTSLFALALIIVLILCGMQFTDYLIDDDDDSRSHLVIPENLCHGAKYRGFMECHHGICGDLSVGESIASSDCRFIWRLEKGGYVSLWDTMPPQQRARSVMDDVEWKLMERQRICDHGIGSNGMLILGDSKMWIHHKHHDATHFCESSWNGKVSSLMVDSNGIGVAEYAFCWKATSQGKVPCHDGRCHELQNGGSLVSEDCQFLLEMYRNGTLVLRNMVNEDRNEVIWTDDLETLLKRLRFEGLEIAEFGLDDFGSVSFIDQWGSTYSVPAECHGAKYRGDLDCVNGICGELLPGQSWTSEDSRYLLRFEELGLVLWDTNPSQQESRSLLQIRTATWKQLRFWPFNGSVIRFLCQLIIETIAAMELDDSGGLSGTECTTAMILRETFRPSATPTATHSTSSPSAFPSALLSPSPFPEPTPKPVSESPSSDPTTSPSRITSQPSVKPFLQPSESSTFRPSESVTFAPSERATFPPSERATFPPSERATFSPSERGTFPPSERATFAPSERGTFPPSERGTFPPSERATFPPSERATLPPSQNPSLPPSSSPILPPSLNPTLSPSWNPSLPPSPSPSLPPSLSPTLLPSSSPTLPPSSNLSLSPSSNPTLPPSSNLTVPPSSSPTLPPSSNPSLPPSSSPSLPPSWSPSSSSNLSHSDNPTHSPITTIEICEYPGLTHTWQDTFAGPTTLNVDYQNAMALPWLYFEIGFIDDAVQPIPTMLLDDTPLSTACSNSTSAGSITTSSGGSVAVQFRCTAFVTEQGFHELKLSGLSDGVEFVIGLKCTTL